MTVDITEMVEQVSAFEARCGVKIEALYAQLSSDSSDHTVDVRGEIHSSSGETLSAAIELILTVYDERGRVISTANTWFNDEVFFGFEPFDLSCFDLAVKPSRLRLYPKIS